MAGIGGRKKAAIQVKAPPDLEVPGIFGSEQLDPILNKMSIHQIATLYKYPEQAISHDLVYLIFFNKDINANHTICATNGDIMLHTIKGWKSTNNALDILRVVATHYKKVVEYAKARAENHISSVDHMKVAEYMRAIATGNDIHVSANCPIHPFIEDGVISIERMVTSVVHVVSSMCMWAKDEWPATVPYSKNNIFDDDVDIDL